MRGMRQIGKLCSAAALFALAAFPARADSVATAMDGGFGRIVFTLDPAAKPVVAMTSGVVTVSFPRQIAIDPAQIMKGFGAYVSAARIDPNGLIHSACAGADGACAHIGIREPLRGRSGAAEFFGRAGRSSAAAAESRQCGRCRQTSGACVIQKRASAYANFSRIVFDWPRDVPYTVHPGNAHITIRFEAQARPDFSGFEHIAPPWVKEAGWRVENGGTVLEFSTDSGSSYHDFRDGAHIVLDILSPKTDADTYRPPGVAAAGLKPKPIVSGGNVPDSKPDAVANAAATAQAAVDAQSKPPQVATAPATQTATTQMPAAQSLAPTPIAAGGQRTRDGAVITFANAAAHPAAVFERGATVWVVLDGAPPIDPARLRSSLGDFPASLDVSSSGGTSLLRITLKQPEKVSAVAIAGNLKVTIAPQQASAPTAIGFVRNEDAPGGVYLTTLVPGALRALQLADPTVGDTLIVIPALTGRGMVEQKSFVDFTALPTAAGLVIAPLADDVAVAVNQSRIRIGRPNGLVLNASVAATPQSPAELMRADNGPTFIDFSNWAKAPGKGFLDSERRLRTRVTQQKPKDVNHARLVLARFYLANQFAAESLGLIDLIQATDPTQQGDSQLQVMRAASDYMMGRYNDAHNDLAASAFDNDPHAAFWRGLIQSALGDETGARQALTLAAPVASHYPADWQSRFHIALAESSLAAGSLESADAELSRLPHDLPRPLLLDSEIARAKLYAHENRKHDAFALFNAVESSGDERAAAQAIFAHVEAGLDTKTLPPATAIDMLEKLRYRWRGDALELEDPAQAGLALFRGSALARRADGLARRVAEFPAGRSGASGAGRDARGLRAAVSERRRRQDVAGAGAGAVLRFHRSDAHRPRRR